MAPRGRKENITGSGSFHKTGGDIGGGPVGGSNQAGRPGAGGNRPSQDFHQSSQINPQGSSDRGVGSSGGGLLLGLLALLFLGKKNNTAASSANGTSAGTSASRGSPLGRIIRIVIIAVVIIAILRACGSLSVNTTSSSNSYTSVPITQSQSPSSGTGTGTTTIPVTAPQPAAPSSISSAQSQDYYDIGSLLGYGVNGGSSATGWTFGDNRRNLNTAVASGARARYYTPRNGDKVNILIYMIGTDLESQSGMATSDLQEMCSAPIADNVNLIVYGGGCTKWHNNAFKNNTNLCYQLKNGGQLSLLYEDGDKTMTDPQTLYDFVAKIGKAYDAENSRNILIFWDHGGGSLQGYGYDQRHARAGSMNLTGINAALEKAGVKFDFIGFDACLMATTETALVCSNYADYLIGSEESEPGIGWYYTNWLKMISGNTATPTLDIGKQIADDFVNQCAKNCPGQSTTLSVIDLAEAQTTIPKYLSNFATATTSLIESEYKTVANARAKSKEFAEGNGIDQVDFVSLAANLGTNEGNNLANALLSCIKYNNTSNDMANSYGLSIFFPYVSTKYVSTAVQTYSGINLGDDYSKCIQAFASYAGAGQASSYGSGGISLSDLLGGYGSSGGYGYSSSYGSPYTSSGSSAYGYSDVYSILESMMGSSLYGRSIDVDVDRAARYISENHLDDADLKFTDGQLKLTDEQWSLITEVMQSCFYRLSDGTRVDLGTDYKDNCITEDGALIGQFDGAWTAINGLPVAYYHMHTFDDGTDWQIMGYVPCTINGQRARLILTFDNEHEYGFVSGAVFDYQFEEGIDTFAKTFSEKIDGIYNFDLGSGKSSDETIKLGALNDGDRIEFVADCYDVNGLYDGTYPINAMTVSGDLEVSYVKVVDSGEAEACYRITDIYGAPHWTQMLENA